ncbi:MAG: mechanosensitive ion channel [Candidatus Eisenbacteria bacterium]|nr:mechanosensitive ion channel [Candidatus Eisenbacteria bacterium]
MQGITWPAVRDWLVSTGVSILLVLVLTYVAMQVLRFGIRQFRRRYEARHADPESVKRVTTLARILRGGGMAILFLVSGMMILTQLGIKMGPVLAAAGIGGLAIGFGAQNLVRDVISGFFILFEDQVRVGDVVQLNGQGGLVEAVTLRHIRLRDLSGTVHYFPNGTIDRVSNMTKEFSYYMIDMGVAYREDVDEVAAVMQRVAEEMRGEEPWSADILEPLEVLGLDKFADSALVVRARIKTVALRQWAAGREFNRRLKKAFDAAGIEIPFPHRTVYWGQAKDGTPARLHLGGLDAAERGGPSGPLAESAPAKPPEDSTPPAAGDSAVAPRSAATEDARPARRNPRGRGGAPVDEDGGYEA